MLIKAVNYSVKSESLPEFVEIVKQAGIDGILSFPE